VSEEDRRKTFTLEGARPVFPGPVDDAQGVVDVERGRARVLEGPPCVVADRKERRQPDIIAVAVRAMPGAGVQLDGRPVEIGRQGARRDVVDAADELEVLHRAGV